MLFITPNLYHPHPQHPTTAGLPDVTRLPLPDMDALLLNATGAPPGDSPQCDSPQGSMCGDGGGRDSGGAVCEGDQALMLPFKNATQDAVQVSVCGGGGIGVCMCVCV